jgi:sec-independent protein translocase protein TatB
MFGMGGSEILVILVIALLFLGPEKLPGAAKQISKGIRDIKRQSRALQQQIENDDQIGGAIRDIKSALRGDEAPVRPKPIKPKKPKALPEATAIAPAIAAVSGELAEPSPTPPADPASAAAADATEASSEPAQLTLTLPPTAGEADPIDGEHADDTAAEDAADLRSMIRPAEGTVAKGSEPKHG